MAAEGSVHRPSRVVGAHFDTGETCLSCRAVCMLLNRAPSWRHEGWPQPLDPPQYLSEQGFGDSDLRELQGDVAPVSHDLRADLDEPSLQGAQGSVFDSLG